MIRPMFKHVNSEFRDVTPELAIQFRDMPGSPTERGLDNSRIDYLHGQIMSGSATTFHWATAEISEWKDGEWVNDGIDSAATEATAKKAYRVNGQHSSHVLALLNGEMPTDMKAVIDHYMVNGFDGLAYLFRQFDPRQSARSKADVAHAYQGLHDPLKDVPPTSARRAIEAIIWYLRRIVGVPGLPVGDDVYTYLSHPDYHPFIVLVGRLLTIKTPEMKKTPVLAAAYATWLKDPQSAELFWGSVAQGGDRYDENAPATRLDGWLKNMQEKKSQSQRDSIKDGQVYQACVYSWNAFRAGKNLTNLRYDTRKGWFEIE